VLIDAANVTSPPPPSMAAVAWTTAVGGIVLFTLAAWVDRHRQPTAG
jgi:hypothetical protein